MVGECVGGWSDSVKDKQVQCPQRSLRHNDEKNRRCVTLTN